MKDDNIGRLIVFNGIFIGVIIGKKEELYPPHYYKIYWFNTKPGCSNWNIERFNNLLKEGWIKFLG